MSCCGSNSGGNYPLPEPQGNQMACVGSNQDWQAMVDANLEVVAVGLVNNKITGVVVIRRQRGKK